MLNEIREYEEYTYDLDNTASVPKRIKYNVLTKGLNEESSGIGCGIESILSIIARHFLFDFNALGALANADAAECAVLAWIGSKPDENKQSALSTEIQDEIESIKGWYPGYIEKILIPEREEMIKQNHDNPKKQNSLKKNIELLEDILDNLGDEKFRRDLEKAAWGYGYSSKNDDKKLSKLDNWMECVDKMYTWYCENYNDFYDDMHFYSEKNHKKCELIEIR